MYYQKPAVWAKLELRSLTRYTVESFAATSRAASDFDGLLEIAENACGPFTLKILIPPKLR